LNPTGLLCKLLHAGVQLWREEGQLCFRAPRGALTPTLRAELAEGKDEIIALLAEQSKYSVLSFSQQRLWFLTQLEPGSVAYNMPGVYRLEGPLDLFALERSINQVVTRHEILRTTFMEIEGQPFQVVMPGLKLELPVVDLRGLTEIEREAEARRIAVCQTEQPFDLAVGPLLRFLLVRLGDEAHLLLRTAHHIIVDGWSSVVLIKELTTAYQALLEQKPAQLPLLPLQYANYAVLQREWLQGQALEEHLSYWKKQLAHLPPVLELSTDRPRPPLQSFRGTHQSFRLDQSLSRELKALSQREGVTMFMLLMAAYQTLLSRYTHQEDIAVGSPVANRSRAEVGNLIGFFVNTLVLRADLSGDPTFSDLLGRVREVALGAYAHQELPFEMLVEHLQTERNLSRSPLFQVMFALQNFPFGKLALPDLTLSMVETETISSKFDLTLSMFESGDGLLGWMEYNTDLFDAVTIKRMLEHFRRLLRGIVADPHRRLSELPLMTEAERRELLVDWNETRAPYPQDSCLHQLFAAQVERSPDAPAVIYKNERLTYRQLDGRAARLAARLRSLGVGPDVTVALCVERSQEMLIGMLGVLKAGGAYVPVDPTIPKKRLAFIFDDARVRVLLTQEHLLGLLPEHSADVVLLCEETLAVEGPTVELASNGVSPEHLAYLIYTSGSTGSPKGVMVTHRNAVNFFTAMNDRLGCEPPGTWLAVTNMTFDISILELLWPLMNGFQVIIQAAPDGSLSLAGPQLQFTDRHMDFSLFYFAAGEDEDSADKYRLLLDGAKFADRHGFSAIWTPERHFHSFGGLYPSPSVVSAAVAAVTEHVRIRAGSVVLPLHNPIRVAEEWSVVDNLSRGRVGISFASGWHANDFVLQPDNYQARKNVLESGIEMVRQLWRGESLMLPDGAHNEFAVKIRPKPIQPELPFWITAAGNPETFQLAGEMGANLLTHLLSQSQDELAAKINIYREAWRKNGHGPGDGHVTLMVHTFVADDLNYVREKVKQPFTNYLRTSVDLMRNLARSLGQDLDSQDFTEEQLEMLLSHAFNRYFQSSALFGTPETCLRMIDQLKGIGVDEVGCLIDFGVDYEAVMSSLHHLDVLRERSRQRDESDPQDFSLPAQISNHGVTHLQLTPSLAQMLVAQTDLKDALADVKKLLVGGEVLPASLARELLAVTSAELLNMYGPTETTIWSTAQAVNEVGHVVPIGRPIANTEIFILDRRMQPVPVGVPGELLIGGAGVARGYVNRADLTAERFIPHPFSASPGATLYRTGDLARYLPDASIEFLGRMDQQIKIRGFRIEPGEVEAVLLKHAAVREAVVVAREESPGDVRLIAYYVAGPGDDLKTGDLRGFLRDFLPDYLVPTVFVALASLPLTPSGKLDRRALPAPAFTRPALEAPYVMPQTEAERMIAAIWQEVLQVETVGIHDNFFDLGGHSLLVVQIHRKLQQTFERKLPLFEMFKYPTVYALAQYLTQEEQQNGSARQQSRDQAEIRLTQRKAVTTQRQSRQSYRAARNVQGPAL
jgi:natural product biosynthesis luciferase-like monooxygenase protein